MPRVHRIDPASVPGIRRVRSRDRFRYVNPDGTAASAADRRRIAALAIPPAWTGLWISPDPDGHIQAVGRDAAGRRQYLYHPGWRARRDGVKFERALELAATLPTARSLVTRHLHGDDLRTQAFAAAFRMLDRGAVRIGSPAYLRRYGSRGLLTLRWADLRLRGDDTVLLHFVGKLGQRQTIEFRDAELADWFRAEAARPPRALILRYPAGRRLKAVTPAELNAYICTVTGGPFTAKDFRTLRGTTTAAQALALGRDTDADDDARERAAIDAVAAALGNTRTVAKASYVDPRVLAAARRGRYLDASRSPENALLHLLDRP